MFLSATLYLSVFLVPHSSHLYHINPAAIIIVFIISPLCSCEGDSKVIKSAERILSIWEERGVYSGTLIADLKNALIKEESPSVTPVEQQSKFAYYFCNF